ncbi:MAG: hypothetical protein Q8P12_00760, partial [bacterium]|nr:hypothetical protein [bacterium]
TKEGMSLISIDPANVAMIYFKIPASLFSEFELDKEEEELGVNLSNLKAVLRRCKPGASLTLEKQDNILKLGLHDRIKRDFSLALIDIDSEEKPLPDGDGKTPAEGETQVMGLIGPLARRKRAQVGPEVTEVAIDNLREGWIGERREVIDAVRTPAIAHRPEKIGLGPAPDAG